MLAREISTCVRTRVFVTWQPGSKTSGCALQSKALLCAMPGFPSAPEKTRTSTDHTVHEALNLVRPVSMLPRATRASTSCGFVDVLDGMDALDVVTSVVTDLFA